MDHYEQWRREAAKSAYDLSALEQKLFLVLGAESYNFIYQLKIFIVEATEHIALELIPIYTRIVKATTVEEILDLTTHPRLVVRYAAVQKIDLIEGRPIRREVVTLNPPRWPNHAWNAPINRQSGMPGGLLNG